jgi:hypothetical protein
VTQTISPADFRTHPPTRTSLDLFFQRAGGNWGGGLRGAQRLRMKPGRLPRRRTGAKAGRLPRRQTVLALISAALAGSRLSCCRLGERRERGERRGETTGELLEL